jgi:tol-pal system protein YbgF
MRITHSWLASVAVVASMTLPICWAKSPLETRIEKLENIIDSQVNIELITQIETLQQEVRELRGKVEEQQHELQLANQKQEKLFLNLDSRIGSASKTPEAARAAPAATHTPTPVASLPETQAETDAIGSVFDLDPVVVTEPLAAAGSATTATASTATEKATYDAAYQLMNSKQYPEAIVAFKDLLVRFPDGTHAANAYYWLGEVYAAQWQHNKSDLTLIEQANNSFRTVTIKYPNHHKAVDALLKLGLVAIDQERWIEARDLLNRVVLTYPGTSRAKLADAKIKSMKEKGKI